MKQLKRIACLSLVSVLFAASSLAEGAPASQFCREQLALSQSKQRLRHNQSAPGLRHGHTCACSQCAAYCRAQAYGQAAAHGSANRQAHGRAHKLREPWGLYYGFRLCARVFCMEFTKC